ncbi:ATP-binding protein [Actinomadura macra]|uniref:ATP-binding protein n=1 Tax=Actinomadura macra TaxID=46164 RepID=UPI000A0399F0|nr:ATP-binding protein [Actinomadura macra]
MILRPRTVDVDTIFVLGAAMYKRDLEQVKVAREWIVKAARCARVCLADGALDDLRLCASETVANAVRYGDAGQLVGVLVIERPPHAIRVEVIDQGNMRRPPHIPHIPHRDPDVAAGLGTESGRGLKVVNSLSTSWGHQRDIDGPGRVVWFEIQRRAAEPTP